jgi:hypothetical protein
VSETPQPTDVEVTRSLAALVSTLNDQGAGDDVARERLQEIVTGTLGGEERILVAIGAGEPGVARLTDRRHAVLARLQRRNGRWVGERAGAPLTGGYIPSGGGA